VFRDSIRIHIHRCLTMSLPNPYQPPSKAEDAPPPAEHGEYRSAGRLVTTVSLLLGAMALGYIAFIVSDSMQLDLLERMETGDFTEEEAESNDARQAVLGVGVTGLYLVCAVVFAMFLHRANRNARALGAEYMKFTPGWTVGWFFVPFANLFKPYQAAKEIWEASRPDGGLPVTSSVLVLWWGSWLASNVTGQLNFRVGMAAETLSQLSNSTRISILDSVISLVSIAFAYLMVTRLYALQQQRSDQRRAIDAGRIR
jgi:hypothetical protein